MTSQEPVGQHRNFFTTALRAVLTYIRPHDASSGLGIQPKHLHEAKNVPTGVPRHLEAENLGPSVVSIPVSSNFGLCQGGHLNPLVKWDGRRDSNPRYLIHGQVP